jgi:hypothetical protein
VTVAPGGEKIDGLVIKRDGAEVGSGSWAIAVPVDPGHHHVEASAPGYKPYTTTIALETDGARQTVVVPVLERAPDLPQSVPGGASGGGFWSPLRIGGTVVAVAGVAGLGVGTAFGLHAISLNNDSDKNCNAQSSCTLSGYNTRHDAQSAGNVSTVAFVAGGVALAAGATMFVLARPRSTGGTAVIAVPYVSNREMGAAFEGVF